MREEQRRLPGWHLSTSETSVNFYKITRFNIPEDGHLQPRLRENLHLFWSSVVSCQPPGSNREGLGSGPWQSMHKL